MAICRKWGHSMSCCFRSQCAVKKTGANLSPSALTSSIFKQMQTFNLNTQNTLNTDGVTNNSADGVRKNTEH